MDLPFWLLVLIAILVIVMIIYFIRRA